MRQSKVTLLWCGADHGQFVTAPGQSTVPCKEQHFSFSWIHYGSCICRTRGKNYRASRGDVLLFQPDQAFTLDYDPILSTSGSYFRFGLSAIPGDWPKQKDWPFKRKMPPNDILRPLLEYVLSNAAESTAEVSLPLQAAIKTAVAAFVCGPLGQPDESILAYPLPVQRVIQWIQDSLYCEPSQKVMAGSLAEIGRVSIKHLHRLFEQHLGQTPLQAVYMYRLSWSLGALRAGQKIESVAREFGFANPAHYVRRFAALFGKSPGTMRDALLKGDRPTMPNLPFLADDY